MRAPSLLLACFTVALASALAACGDSKGGPAAGGPGAAASGQPADLAELARAIEEARKGGDAARVTALAHSLIPTTDDLKKLTKPGAATDAFLAKYPYKDLPAEGDAMKEFAGGILAAGKPERTEIRVHKATTEEVAAYEKGGVAFNEFPGGMRRFAEKVAAPGLTWAVVEIVEPGKDSGMKYTCFARLGDRWIFLGKPWNLIPEDK